MTIRERIAAALHKEPVDQIPFTIYPGIIPVEGDSVKLRELGLGWHRRTSVAASATPHVECMNDEYEQGGERFVRRTLRTPVGEVYCTFRLNAAYGSSWYVDHYVKRPENYRVVEFMVRDTVYTANYEAFHQTVAEVGEDGYVSCDEGYSPLLEMQVNLLGLDRFATDRYDCPDSFWSLYVALREKHRELYPILANGPAELISYCGNCSPEVLGRDFETHVVPCLDELGAMLHAKGKLLGCHLDANNVFWQQAVAASQLDVIEAFTPAPDTDMSVADARAVWPDKVLWINFPSSVHIASEDRIREETRRLVREATPNRGFIIGITENIPEHAWRTSLALIARTLVEEGGAET